MPDNPLRARPDAIDRLTSEAAGDDDAVLMLNMNRYSTEAGFPGGEEYRRYMDRLEHSVTAGGGRVLWRTPVTDTVIGSDHDAYDEILAVWYPSHSAFLELPSADGADLMFASRKLCVTHATILAMPADRDPLRPSGAAST